MGVPTGPNKVSMDTSYIGWAIRILEKKKGPMYVCDVTEEILKHKKNTGKTPEKTVSCVLQRSNLFKRTRKGYILLKKPKWMK